MPPTREFVRCLWGALAERCGPVTNRARQLGLGSHLCDRPSRPGRNDNCGMAHSNSLTERLQLFMEGDPAVTESLLHEVLPRLREIAARELKREHPVAPLSKTELIHELWLSNLSKGGWQIHDQGHFFALASLAMRRILVDLARRRLALRRITSAASLCKRSHARPVLR